MKTTKKSVSSRKRNGTTSGTTNGEPSTPIPPGIGEGYRELEDSEVIMEGDEYLSLNEASPQWKATNLYGLNISVGGAKENAASGEHGQKRIYRRKIGAIKDSAQQPEPKVMLPNPGEGYRLLDEDEAIRHGDECALFYPKTGTLAGSWELSQFGGNKVSRMLKTLYGTGETFISKTSTAYRRKVDVTEPSQSFVDAVSSLKSYGPAPGEGYALLNSNETIRPGDECALCRNPPGITNKTQYHATTPWRAAMATGNTVREEREIDYRIRARYQTETRGVLEFRRKIQATPTPHMESVCIACRDGKVKPITIIYPQAAPSAFKIFTTQLYACDKCGNLTVEPKSK